MHCILADLFSGVLSLRQRALISLGQLAFLMRSQCVSLILFIP